MVAGAEGMSSGKTHVNTGAARAGMEWESMAYRGTEKKFQKICPVLI
jgi:hypothetical protein